MVAFSKDNRRKTTRGRIFGVVLTEDGDERRKTIGKFASLSVVEDNYLMVVRVRHPAVLDALKKHVSGLFVGCFAVVSLPPKQWWATVAILMPWVELGEIASAVLEAHQNQFVPCVACCCRLDSAHADAVTSSDNIEVGIVRPCK